MSKISFVRKALSWFVNRVNDFFVYPFVSTRDSLVKTFMQSNIKNMYFSCIRCILCNQECRLQTLKAQCMICFHNYISFGGPVDKHPTRYVYSDHLCTGSIDVFDQLCGYTFQLPVETRTK